MKIGNNNFDLTGFIRASRLQFKRNVITTPTYPSGNSTKYILARGGVFLTGFVIVGYGKC